MDADDSEFEGVEEFATIQNYHPYPMDALPSASQHQHQQENTNSNNESTIVGGEAKDSVIEEEGRKRQAASTTEKNDANSIDEESNDEELSCGIKGLRTVREKLTDSCEDPLKECYSVAEKANSTPSQLSPAKGQERKSRSDLPWSLLVGSERHFTDRRVIMPIDSLDSDENTDEENNCGDESGPVILSDLPQQPSRKDKKREPQERGIIPSSPSGKPTRKKRRFWTDEEKNAVREGVKHFGRGNWNRIKAKYSFVLRNRTSVQIKDCYRTLVNRGET